MPNGRSGGFLIETADLKRLVQGVSAAAVVGKFTTGSKFEAVHAKEIVRLIEQCPHDRLAVEELDHAFYVIHFSNEPKEIAWLMVGSTLPLFEELGSRHVEWMAGHPGWNG
jgi:hypothetical protein